jgi:uncharacterized repeat protein (TIGR03803 family)
MGEAVPKAENKEKNMNSKTWTRIIALTLFAALALGVGATQPAQAQTFTDLYSFSGSTDGGYPYAGLIRDNAGTLYGTTQYGGSSLYGTVFKVDTTGTETVLHSFTGGADGGYPYASVIQDNAGNLYGTANIGGASGYGVVFKVDTTGTETVLHSFAGGTTDGCFPYQGLVEDQAGTLYGTTVDCGASGQGIVFKLSKKGKLTVLHSFAGGSSDGGFPQFGSLLRDKVGNLYGVAEEGGAASQGVVYKLNEKGTLTVLHSFAGGSSDGCYPFGAVDMDKAGVLYGTTEQCGASNAGTVWKLTKKGKETVLYNFTGGADGGSPFAGVVLDAKGNLYGDTDLGGSSSFGTVFEVSKKGTEKVLHSFAGSDGEIPLGGVIRDAKGNVYGTTVNGGSGSYGTVWTLTP